MRAALAAAAAAALGAAAFGCTKPRTEAVIVITTAGVRIPEDLHKVHLLVQDRSPAADDVVFDQDVNLCHDALTTGCFEIPVSAVLFPGKTRGQDSVRVQVDAIGTNEMPVISNAAVFTFADEQSLRLDFVLYANCLGNVECAQKDKACGPDDKCIDITPVSIHGEPDLARPPPLQDMATPMPADMTMVDLAGADLYQAPADLVSILDMAGCDTVSCAIDQVCVAGTCQHCGDYREPCCQGPLPGRAPNIPPAPVGGMCNAGNLTCNGSICVFCGQDTQLCCAGNTCFSGNVCNLGSGMCEPPQMPDMSGGGGAGGGGGGGGGGLPGDMF